MQARMKHPVYVLPDALKALFALDKATEKDALPYLTRKLVHLRASQINGCSVCVDMHAKELKKAGESDDRVFAVAAWREGGAFRLREIRRLAPGRDAARRPPGGGPGRGVDRSRQAL